MESPFDAIRKNQKAMLAVLGVMAMISFVVLPPLMDMMQTRSGGDEKSETNIAATWKYGNITNSELQSDIHKGRVISNLLGSVYARSHTNGLKTIMPGMGGDESRMAVESAKDICNQLFAPTEAQAVQNLVLEKLGEELGIKIARAQIDAFIDEFREDRVKKQFTDLSEERPQLAFLKDATPYVTADEMNQFLASYAQGDPWLDGDSLRKELGRAILRQEAFRLIAARGQETPLVRWENYVKLNQRASVLAMPVLVETLINQIPDPTAADLQKFFDERKDKLQQPNSPEYGFLIPARADFQYFRIDNQQLLAAQKPLVTEAEIAAYYEQHKATKFVKSDLPTITPLIPKLPELPASLLPALPDTSAPPATTPEKGTDPPAKESEKTAEKGTPEAGAADKSATEKGTAPENASGEKSDPDKAGTAKATTEKAQPEKPAAEKAAGEKPPATVTPPAVPEETPTKPGTPAKAGTKSQSAAGRRRVIPVAFQAAPEKAQAAKSDAAKVETANDKAAATKTEPAKTEPNKTAGEKAESTKSATQPAASTESAAKETSPPVAPVPPTATTPAANDPGAATPPSTPSSPTPPAAPPIELTTPLFTKPVEYDSLDKVRDQIVTDIAREKVAASKAKLVERLEASMRKYSELRELAEVKRDPSKPFVFAPFDLQKVAAENAVESRELPLQSAQQLLLTELGKSLIEVRVEGNQMQRFEFGRVALDEKFFTLFSPTVTRSLVGEDLIDYLVWKTAEYKAEVPKLDNPDVKLQVIRAWKTGKVRDLALKQAEAYAARARQEGKTLNELQASDPNVPVPAEVNDFNWLKPSFGPGGQRLLPVVSTPSGLDHPGTKFMEQVFGLPMKGIGVAFNQPESIAYVIQVVKRDDLEATREKYLNDVRTPLGYSQFAAAGREDRMREQRAVYENLRNKYELQEKRKLDARAEEN